MIIRKYKLAIQLNRQAKICNTFKYKKLKKEYKGIVIIDFHTASF